MAPASISIAGRLVGSGQPPYVIAELSGNHAGRIENALALVDAARKAGADAVKLQTYTADSLTIQHDGPGFRIEGGLWDGRTLYDLYGEAQTPWEWHEALFDRAREVGITIFSSPFDQAAIDLLEALHCPVYKVASAELVDIPLIRAAAQTGKPLILSTGMATLGEIETAVRAARETGCEELALLHCVSGYPTPPEEIGLDAVNHLAAAFDVPVGFSDHTAGIGVAVAAVARGASIIEKHVCLDRSENAVDSPFSLEPPELGLLVRSVQEAFSALGAPRYGPSRSEEPSVRLRRSLYAVQDIGAGEQLTSENVRSIRPAGGLPPVELSRILGANAARDIHRGEPLTPELVRLPLVEVPGA